MSKRAEEAALKAYPKRKDGRLRWYSCTDDDIRKVYAQGYRKAEKGLGWHSVDESLPETGEEVIVLIDEFNFHLFYRVAFGHIVNEKETVDVDGKPYKPESHNGWNIPGVKFWMPMPKIPKE